MPLRVSAPRLFATLALAAAWSTPSAAQLMLPGASAPTPQGAVQPASPGQAGPSAPAAPRPPAGPVAVKIAGEDALVGKSLFLKGTRGKLVIERKDKTSLAATVIASGDKISKPTEACGIDLGGGRPIDLKPAGRPDGVLRYTLDFPACPLTFDMLDGAVLVTSASPSCTFTEADCRVEPRGMWGPAPSAIEAVGGIESDRGRADKAVRDNFKALLSRTKGKAEIKQVAAEQAGFTSERETICGGYAREAAHGYCASRYTEWRAASLAARLNRLDGKPENAIVAAKPAPKPKPKPATDGGLMSSAPAEALPTRPATAPPPPPATKSIFDIFR